MSITMLPSVLGRTARALGVRFLSTAQAPSSAFAESTSVAQFEAGSDPIMRPYYEQLARLRVVPAAGPHECSPSEREAEMALLRLNNISLPVDVLEGHMIKAKVLEVGRRTVTLDTGVRPARVARSDLPADCILGSTSPIQEPRQPGELREGDVVQVFLESVGTLEGNMLASGVQASAARRMAAVWSELEQRHQRGELVKGRILNAVGHGYAVGVAGIIAFLPARQCSRPTARRIGQLQKFRILAVDSARPTLVLADPNLHHPNSRPGSTLPAQQPRSSLQEAQRRQELTRVADELRSVLALRGSSSGTSRAPVVSSKDAKPQESRDS